MSDLQFLGIRPPTAAVDTSRPREQLVIRQHPLRQVLAFTGQSIDTIVNCPIAKAQVLGFFKLHKFVHRRMEVTELEKQWNSVG